MKKSKIIITILIMFFISITITGCSYEELNELAIASALGIDYEDNSYKITAQILDFEKGEEAQKETVNLYEGVGKTIGEAIRNIYLQYPNKLHLGHLELIVINEGAVNKKFDDVLDYFLRSPEARSDAYLLVALNSSSKDILTPSLESEKTFTSDKIVDILKESERLQGSSSIYTVEDIAKVYLSKKVDPVLAAVKYKDDPSEFSNVVVTNLVALKNDNTITEDMNNNIATAYNLLYEKFNDIMLNINFNDDLIDIIVFKPKSEIKTNIKNNKLTINIKANVQGNISLINKDYNLQEKKLVSKLEKKTNAKLYDYINELIKFCQDNNVDLLGIKENIYKNHYKNYKNFKDKDINDLYQNIEIKVNTKINRYGNIYKGIGGNK